MYPLDVVKTRMYESMSHEFVGLPLRVVNTCVSDNCNKAKVSAKRPTLACSIVFAKSSGKKDFPASTVA